MMASRSSGLPSDSQLDGSALLKADKLLATIQGDDAVSASQRPKDFFESTGAALQRALPPLRAYVAGVQDHVTSAVDASLSAVVGMCSDEGSCLAAFSFDQTTRLGYKPADDDDFWAPTYSASAPRTLDEDDEDGGGRPAGRQHPEPVLSLAELRHVAARRSAPRRHHVQRIGYLPDHPAP